MNLHVQADGRRAHDRGRAAVERPEVGEAGRHARDASARRRPAVLRVRVRARPPRAREGTGRRAPGAPRRPDRDGVAGPPRRPAPPTPRRSHSATPCSGGCGRRAAGPDSLHVWDRELARHGIELMRPPPRAGRGAGGALRRSARRSSACRRRPRSTYRPRSGAHTARELEAELRERLRRRSRARLHHSRPPSRRPASCAPQVATCAATGRRASSGSACSRCCWRSATCCEDARDASPVLLLDDVLSELDPDRRARPARRSSRPRSDADHDGRPRAPCPPGSRSRGCRCARRPAEHELERSGGDRVSRRPRPLAEALPVPEGTAGAARPSWRRCRTVGRRPWARRSPAHCEPVSERAGVVTVRCDSGVWAAELSMMSAQLAASDSTRLARPSARCARSGSWRAAEASTCAGTASRRARLESRMRPFAAATGSGSPAVRVFPHSRGKFRRLEAPDSAPQPARIGSTLSCARRPRAHRSSTEARARS